MSIESVLSTIGELHRVERAVNGLLVKTHCMYPDFERVTVVVNDHGISGFVISDDRRAAKVLRHLDEEPRSKALSKASGKFRVHEYHGALFSEAEDLVKLNTHILLVANASAFAAWTALEHEATNGN